MLAAYADRTCILQSVNLCVNEVLCEQVSAKPLFDWLISITLKPRASVKVGNYRGPAPEPAAEVAAGARWVLPHFVKNFTARGLENIPSKGPL